MTPPPPAPGGDAAGQGPATPPAVVLASRSPARRAMLAAAGVPVEVAAVVVDEAAIRQSMQAAGAAVADVATALAELKALRAAGTRPDALVVGADQMLECDGRWFDKPADAAAVRETLLALRGRGHSLVSSVVVVRHGARIWHRADRAELAMRDFSEAFLDDYLARHGADLTASVGGYLLEGQGAQLFDSVRGDFFTVLGLPLLPLLGFLRGQGVLLR